MTSEAQKIYQSMKGIICTYKQAGCSINYVLHKLKSNICAELNKLDTAPPKLYQELQYSGTDVLINARPSYADNVLCSGPRYKAKEIDLIYASELSELMSGVFVVCINGSKNLKRKLKRVSFTKCFHIKGILGQATANFHIDNKVVAKARYDKVDRVRFEKILASYQSLAQRKMYEEYGFLLTSQDAYDFTVDGLYRPHVNVQPIIYNMKLINFEPPNFTLEVQCIHPTEAYLLHLIHNLGLNLRCYATCESLRCIRYGGFHVQHALVKEQWNLKEITESIPKCRKIFNKHFAQVRRSSTVETVKEKPAVNAY